MIEIDSLFNKLKQSTLFKAVAAYAVFSFIVVQVASLVSDIFGFNQEFMQNLIWIFVIGFPFLALAAWAASSKFSTFKILGIFLFVLVTGYGSGSYIWVNNFVLPELKKELEKDDYVGAWDKVNQLNSFAPFFYNSNSLDQEISSAISLNIAEPGVTVSWQPYTTEKDYEWRYLGTSPLSPSRLPLGVLKLKLEKEGYKTKFIVDRNPSFIFENHPIDLGWALSPVQMYPKSEIPEGMIPIDGGRFIPALIGEGVTEYHLSTYYIDQYEVTNKKFQEFVDAKGYEIFQNWTDMEFILKGESLSWEEAKDLMIDTTGNYGPANWELGSFRDGEGDYPVTGISWYEAQAYARFKGNILPPMYHWAKAAFPPTEIGAPISPVLLKKSNFSNQSVKKVGTNGIGAHGTYDMAGNVREWSWNIFGGRGLTLGGAFSDPAYSASSATPSPRFVRSELIGFRTIRLLNPRDMNPFGDPINRAPPKPQEFYKPFTDDQFRIYSKNFEVGYMEQIPKIIYVDESHPTWIKERIKIKVGYDNEEMDILIFKPKKSFNKLESVIIYPGANYYRTPPDIDDVNPGEYGLDFIIKSGRALVWPAYKGSMNRITDLNISFPSTQDQFRLFRQLLTAWTVDTSRTIDYLQSREDMDPDNLFYVGMSYGSLFTTHVLLFEKRFNAAILYVGGALSSIPPMSDGINHYPRITSPILMLNGEQDYLVPPSAPRAMYSLIGTPEDDKRLVFYDSGHWPLPRNQMIKETLAWMDKYSTN